MCVGPAAPRCPGNGGREEGVPTGRREEEDEVRGEGGRGGRGGGGRRKNK